MSGICVEDSNGTGLGIPVDHVVSDELKVEDRSRKILEIEPRSGSQIDNDVANRL